jgi:O-antigen ligase
LSLFDSDYKIRFLKFFKNSWDTALYLFLLILGLLYSQDLSAGLSVLETSFSLFAIPVILSRLSTFDKKFFINLLFSFLAGLIVASLICLTSSAYSYFQTGDFRSFLFYQLTEQIDLQPTYMAYYVSFAITLLLYSLYYETISWSKWSLIAIIFFLFTVLMLTAGRTAYISMLLTFSFFMLKFFFEETFTSKKRTAFIASIVLLTLMLTVNYFDLNTGYISDEVNNDYWERLTLWRAALHASPDFLFGVGTGDYKIVLNQYFMSHDLYQYAKSNYNSHNQFIQTLFSNGLIGLISLLFLIVRPIYLSLRHQNILGILVFFPFLIYGITEVFLGRYQGVVFFALLHETFITFYHSRNSPALKGF